MFNPDSMPDKVSYSEDAIKRLEKVVEAQQKEIEVLHKAVLRLKRLLANTGIR